MRMCGRAVMHLPPCLIPQTHETKHLPHRRLTASANKEAMMAFNHALPDGYRPSDDGSHAVFTEPIEASLNDDRSYKLILLPNEMEILLVHDPNTDKSAAAMDVHVGNLTDPVSKPFPLFSHLRWYFREIIAKAWIIVDIQTLLV